MERGPAIAITVVGAVVAETGITTYLAGQEAAPYHEQGDLLLHGTCANPNVQQAVATAVGDRIADTPRLDPTTIPGVSVDPTTGDVSVASNHDACVGALDSWKSGHGLSHAAREAALNTYAQTDPDGAAKIHELLNYLSHWAVPAALGGAALLGGTAWAWWQIFVAGPKN